MPNIIVANAGSSSQKYATFKYDGSVMEAGPSALSRIAGGNAQKVHIEGLSPVKMVINGEKIEGEFNISSHEGAIRFFYEALKEKIPGFTTDAVGYKWVYAGEGFIGTHVLHAPGDNGERKVVELTRQFEPDFPRHNPYYLAALEAYSKLFPDAVHVGSMERSFHYSIPLEARAMGLPKSWVDEYENPIGKGFHSASLRSVLYNASKELEIPIDELSAIIMHLGGTGTIEAVKDGKSADTSLQWAAVGGLLHNTAIAESDAYYLLGEMDRRSISTDEMRSLLSKDGGLEALSGIKGGDMKDILEWAEGGDPKATFAIDAFVYGAKKLIGGFSYAAFNNKTIDAIIFSGGIGEKSSEIRKRIMEGAQIYGFEIDEEKNLANETKINAEGSGPILVMPTDEELIVAFYTALAKELGRDLKPEEMTGFLK